LKARSNDCLLNLIRDLKGPESFLRFAATNDD